MASRRLRAGRPAWVALAFAFIATGGPAQAQGFFDIFAPPPMQSGAQANEPLMPPEQRRAVQRELGNRGFYRGSINGSLNRETRHAIARWQASIRQNPSGYLTRGQLANLLSAPQPVAPPPDAPADAQPLPAAPAPVPSAPVATAARPAAVTPASPIVLGDAYWSDQVPSLASTAGLTVEAFATRQATALHAVLTATGYEAWIRDHPGQATASRLIGFLAPLWLGDAQIRRLFFELVDGQGNPIVPAVGAGNALAERTTALLTAIEALGPQALARLQQRFDEQYRPLILMQASKALRLTSVETLELGAYDAQAGGYRPADGTTLGDGRLVDEGPRPGQGWPQIVLRTDGPARPALVAMAERPASGTSARIYMARVVTAETVSLAFGGPRLEILVSGKQQGLTLHPDAALQQRLPAPPTAGSMQATTFGRGPDVLGIRLGMELSDAQQILAGHMPGHRSVEIAQRDPGQQILFGTARALVAADNSEVIALVTQPEKSGTRIVAIGRRLFGGPDAYDREALIADLSAKYGGPPLRAGALLHWGGQASAAETVCHVMLGTVDLGPWTDASGRALRWQDYLPPEGATDFRGPGPMYWIGLRAPSPERAQEYAACLPTVAVYISGAGPRASEFTLWLTDAKAYMGLLSTPATPAPATAAARPKL